jgi:hypothetical protein
LFQKTFRDHTAERRFVVDNQDVGQAPIFWRSTIVAVNV